LAEMHPQLILSGTAIDLVGAGFVDPSLGGARLALHGTFTPAAGDAVAIDLSVGAAFLDETHLRAFADTRFFKALPSGDGHFDGDATVIVDSTLDGAPHSSKSLPVSIDIARTAAPVLDDVVGGTLYVNGMIR